MTYYWGRKSKTTIVEFMGVFTFRAPYLPWFYLVISFLLESDFKSDLYGLLIGHLYFFLKEILPRIKASILRFLIIFEIFIPKYNSNLLKI